MACQLLFASAKPTNLEPKNSLGAKWERLLGRLELGPLVKGRRVAVKMHLGGGTGFTTVHPFFVRRLVQKLQAAGASEVFVTDSPGAVRSAVDRGYTTEVLGCALVPVTGTADKYFQTTKIAPAFRTLTAVQLAGEVMDADVLVDLAHVKGHGACGFGGAAKNLAMGCVTQATRRALHALEGGLEWDAERCSQCHVCQENCPNGAIKFASGKFDVFYHHCKFCQHCVLICPEKALRLAATSGGYRDFQQGLALTTAKVLERFGPDRCLFLNLLLDVTIYCDCWGMTTPQLVPDIGILAGRDLVAIEQATLDLIRVKDLIRQNLPAGWKLGKGKHLFQKLYGKDPHTLVAALAKLGCGDRAYALTTVD